VIDVHSKVGQGTTFYIYLPAVDRVPVAVPFGAEVKKFETAQMNGHSKTILLVEDDPDLRTLMSEILQEYGYIVMSACDGEEGLRLFQQHMQDIALVVADVVTPKMKGNELHRRIRALKAETRFLFVSGYQADEISHNFVLDSGLSFLPKPFDLDELAAKVQKVLEENSASAQTAS
jgi:DNA-binding response OmpR family regulator